MFKQFISHSRASGSPPHHWQPIATEHRPTHGNTMKLMGQSMLSIACVMMRLCEQLAEKALVVAQTRSQDSIA